MRFRAAVPAFLGLAMLLSVALVVLGQPAPVTGQQPHRVDRAHKGGHIGMTDAAMKRWAESWWASHPRVGTASVQAPAATFTVRNFYFDKDNNASTQVDTAKIMIGESVLWTWIIGFHTITSGVDSGDPDAGTLFNQPSDSGNQQFTFTFNAAGTYPFFCTFHEFLDMKGVVVVSSPVGVEPLPGAALGFTAGPTPNPAKAGAELGFALRQPGRAHAEVFDVRGRLVAVILDRHLPTGSHAATWDGRSLAGGMAPAGIYYVRLRLPGFTGARPLVIAR